MNQREHDGMDFADYVYDANLHRWLFRPLAASDRETEEAEARADAAAERRRELERERLDSVE